MTKATSFKPKKSLGQNFLVNTRIAEKIVDACNFKPSDTILEIGPGKGALTSVLAQQCKKVLAVEKDKKLAQQLQRDFERTNIEIVGADILRYPFATLPKNTKVIGNLPYNIATPIIKKIIHHKELFPVMYATVQLEFGQRIIAKPHTKDYGSFSCFMQFHANTKILFKIRNTAFQPIPKVQSCFLEMNLLKKPKYQVNDKDLLFQIIRSCFAQRRKTIQNSLAGTIAKNDVPWLLQKCQIDSKSRAENLSLEDYVKMTNVASEEGSIHTAV